VLLAHRLAHVVQQNSGRIDSKHSTQPQTYTVRPDHAPLSAEEVLILMAMTSRKMPRRRDQADRGRRIRVRGASRLSVRCVGDMLIQLTIGQPEPEGEASGAGKQAAPKKAAHRRSPEPAIEAEQLTASAPLPAEIESALDDPYVKRFFERQVPPATRRAAQPSRLRLSELHP
jgi:hypothetical protein